MTLPVELTADSDTNRYVETDYERSRATLYQLLEQGKEALELSMEVAKESEHPRAIEVLSGLMKNVADLTEKIMDLNKKHKEFYEHKSHKDDPSLGATNILFTGTTTDLQKMLSEAAARDTIDVTPNE